MGCGASTQRSLNEHSADESECEQPLQRITKVDKEFMKSLGLRYACFDVNVFGENKEHAVLQKIFSFGSNAVLYKIQIPVVDTLEVAPTSEPTTNNKTKVDYNNNSNMKEDNANLNVEEERESSTHETNSNSHLTLEKHFNKDHIDVNNGKCYRNANDDEHGVISDGDKVNRVHIDADRNTQVNIHPKCQWWLLNDSKYTFILYMTLFNIKEFGVLPKENGRDTNNIEVEFLPSKLWSEQENKLDSNSVNYQNDATTNNKTHNEMECFLEKDGKEIKNNINNSNNNIRKLEEHHEAISRNAPQNVKIVATIPPFQLLPFIEGRVDAHMWVCKIRKNLRQTQLFMAKPVGQFFVDEDRKLEEREELT